MTPSYDAARETDTQPLAPSADYITAISEFFETDPSDLLQELGFYKRTEESALPTE